MRRWSGLAVSVMLAALTMFPLPARAESNWLDDQSVSWNQPGLVIPQAPPPPGGQFDPRCLETVRPGESPEELALENAGWKVFGSYTGGWGVRIVGGMAGADGMCRPIQFQSFVFVDGKLAGTLSPNLMDSRTDGALSETNLYSNTDIIAQYIRYTGNEPLCCPSALSTVTFKLDRSGSGPVLVRESTDTEPTGRAGLLLPAPRV